jgi:hypothetical protein
MTVTWTMSSSNFRCNIDYPDRFSRGFSQYQQTNSGYYPKMEYNRLHPHIFRFIIHYNPNVICHIAPATDRDTATNMKGWAKTLMVIFIRITNYLTTYFSELLMILLRITVKTDVISDSSKRKLFPLQHYTILSYNMLYYTIIILYYPILY